MVNSRRAKRLLFGSFLICCVLASLAFVLWGYFGEYELKTHGYFLIVQIESKEQPIILACFENFRKEQAAGWVENINRTSVQVVKNDLRWRSSTDSAVVHPFDGKPIKLENTCYDDRSLFGRTVNWSQNYYMTVYAEWGDGRKVCKIVEIPDARISKEMSIQLP